MTFTEIAAKARELSPMYGSEGGVIGTNRDMVLVGALAETLAVFEYNTARILTRSLPHPEAPGEDDSTIQFALQWLRVPIPQEVQP